MGCVHGGRAGGGRGRVFRGLHQGGRRATCPGGQAQGLEATARKAADEQRALAVKAQGLEATARKAADEQRALAVKAQGLEATAAQGGRRALELANRYLYFLRVNQAEAAWRDILPLRTSELLDVCPPEQRGWEWYYLDHQRHAPLLEFKDYSGVHAGVAYSPDGRHIAYAVTGGTV